MISTARRPAKTLLSVFMMTHLRSIQFQRRRKQSQILHGAYKTPVQNKTSASLYFQSEKNNIAMQKDGFNGPEVPMVILGVLLA